MRNRPEILSFVVLAAGVGVLSALVRAVDPAGESAPQVVRGEGVLATAFGDARETISQAMVHKADSYMHGGIDMECTEDHDHDHDCDGHDCHHDHHDSDTKDCDNHPDHHDESDLESNNQTIKQSNNSSFPDPWAWINEHIRAPEIEKHLEGEKAVEMMPWFWAAVKANPHNIDAWTTAIYTADHIMKDDKLTGQVIDDAKHANPLNLEILMAEGTHLYKHGKGDVDAAKKIFTQICNLALQRCDNNPDNLEENDRWMYKFALNYLRDIEKRK